MRSTAVTSGVGFTLLVVLGMGLGAVALERMLPAYQRARIHALLADSVGGVWQRHSES